MKKPTERLLEIYHKYPYLLIEEEKKWIEHWVKNDVILRQISAFYKAFYSNLKKIQENRPVKAGIITLKHKNRKKEHQNGFVLAAESLSIRSHETETVKTFISEEHNMVLRFIKNPNQNEYIAYVLSEFGAEDDIFLLQNEKDQDFLISQPGGKFIFNSVKEHCFDPLEWQSCRLFIPIVQMLVYKDENTGNLTFSFNNKLNSDFIDVSLFNDHLVIQILHSPKEQQLTKVICKNDIEVELIILNSSRITFPISKFISNTSYINFYN